MTGATISAANTIQAIRQPMFFVPRNAVMTIAAATITVTGQQIDMITRTATHQGNEIMMRL